jgi:peptidoglycan hydrolase-like protein with peptidoglycan-binding domain
MSDSNLKLIQTGLTGLGHDPGPIDGRFGPRFRTAILALLNANGAARSPAVIPPGPVDRVIRQGSAGYPVREIVVHCAATLPDWMAGRTLADKRAEIRRWHVEGRGWADIGYHWLIDRDGQYLAGRAETVIGAGVEGHNTGVIHICLIGGHGSASSDRFDRHFTTRQAEALRRLIADVRLRTLITRVSGHNEWAAKACPGFHVPTWLKEAA